MPISESVGKMKMVSKEIASQKVKDRTAKRLSRSTLEKLLADKTQEVLKKNAEITELKESCKELKVEIKEWKTKADNLAKTCTNLSSLVKSHIGQQITPKKTTGIELKEAPSLKRSSDGVASPSTNTKRIKTDSEPKKQPSLPPLPNQTDTSQLSIPKPNLGLNKTQRGLEVLWNFDTTVDEKTIKCYELYACNLKATSQSGASWKKVGVINSITLPIKVTLSDFKSNSTYHFAVRPKGHNGAFGQYSDIEKIDL